MYEELKELFFSLLEVDSPSGFEEPMIRRLMTLLEPLCDEVYQTPRGNVVGVQRGTDPDAPKVALAAHMDQVGFVVFNIDPRGFIRFRKLGGAVDRSIQGHQVKILTEKDPIVGVVGLKPGHITRPEEARQIPPIEEMYIDIGARSPEECADRGVKVGTPIVWNTRPVELGNGLVATAAADDRAGLAAILTVARNLKDRRIPATVYYIGTVEEENGLRGAAVAAYDLDVDMAVAVDTCAAGWQPDVNMRDLLYEIGEGPCMQIGEFSSGGLRLESQVVRRWLREAADANGLPYQTGFQHGGTDASALQQTRSGLPAVAFSVPRRYSHSPVEVLSMGDLHNLAEILTHALSGLRRGFSTLRVQR
ncbi:MAG TPA: M20/M25/M40 family metallo-hydrolase [Candidatus Desulfaltia sp.]|nr:M20/M25/M40 family metallo-hydrolase [Candidatus Desulfaltia sp.]